MKTPLLTLLLAAAALGAKPYAETIPGTDVKFEMVPIPGGKFTMGSPATEKGRKADEGPQFEVEVEPFYMGKCEVTWGEFEAFAGSYHLIALKPSGPQIPQDKLADAVTYPTPMHRLIMNDILDEHGGRGPDMPAITMSHFAAGQYTKWLSRKTGRFYRLPTEAEWEYACRAGSNTAYSFGDDPADLKRYAWDFDQAGDRWQFHRVGQKKPNAWGLHDMHGNVAEWCLDRYSPDWYEQFGGRTVKAKDAVNWPTTRYPRVIRGGTYESEAADCRSAARRGSDKNMNLYDPDTPRTPHWETAAWWIGVRVVSPTTEPPEAEKARYWALDDPATRKVLERDREMREVIEPGPPRAPDPD